MLNGSDPTPVAARRPWSRGRKRAARMQPGTRLARGALRRIVLEAHGFANGDTPAAAREPGPEPIAHPKLPHVAAHGARRPEPQRYAHVAPKALRVSGVPRASIVEERGHTDRHEPPHLVRDEDAIFQGEPHHARAGEFVDAEDAGAVPRRPQVEFAARLGPAQGRALEVKNQGVTRQVLARDRQSTGDAPRVRCPHARGAAHTPMWNSCETFTSSRRAYELNRSSTW